MTGLRHLFFSELMAQVRTYRLLTYAAALFVTGIGSMITLRYLPDILELTGEGIVIQFPEQTAVDAMLGYGGNVVQIGTLLVVLLAMGSVARERENGIASLILSKPVSESAYVLAKLLAHLVSIAITMVVVSSFAAVYAIGLFPGELDAGAVWYVVTLFLFLSFSVAVTVAGSCFLKSQIAAGLGALLVVTMFGVAASLPVVGAYVPGALLGWGGDELAGGSSALPWEALLATLVLAVGAVLLAIRRLKTSDV